LIPRRAALSRAAAVQERARRLARKEREICIFKNFKNYLEVTRNRRGKIVDDVDATNASYYYRKDRAFYSIAGYEDFPRHRYLWSTYLATRCPLTR
jgi:hypothetical protein